MTQSSNKPVNSKSSASYLGRRDRGHLPGYAPGHYGDPQYAEAVHYTLDIPEDFFGLVLKGSDGVVDDNLPKIKNPRETFYFTDEDGVDSKKSAEFLSKFVVPKLTKDDLSRRVAAGDGGPDTFVALTDRNGDDLEELDLSQVKTDAELDAWLKESINKHFKTHIENEKNWAIREPNYDPPDDGYASAEASNVVPTLETLMDRLEKAGMQKYASRIRDVVAQLHLDPFKLKNRPRLSRGSPPSGSGYTFDPSQKMLQEGERYTEIDPQTGAETTKRYQMEKPLKTHQLGAYFNKGMFDTDFFERELAKETNPFKKGIIRQLLDKAVAQEEADFSKKTSAEHGHWLSKPIELHMPVRKDPTETFLMESLKTSPEGERAVIVGLLDKYRGSRSPGVAAVRKCASALRQKGYDALADRLDSKVAAGIYGPHVGVRIRSMKEYVAESKAKGGDDKSLFDEMLDKYVRVLEGAAAIVKKTKVQVHDPKDLEDAMKPILAGDQLMMQKLLEIGEPIKETW